MKNQENANLTFTTNTDVWSKQETSCDTSVTAAVFEDLIECFDCANKKHFGGALSQPVMSFTRHPKVKCCFLPKRYQRLDGVTVHGFMVNSDYCLSVGDKKTMHLVGFLMVQQARQKFGPVNKKGKYGTPGYVDAWCKQRLLEIGLIPTHDGTLKGKQTGYGLSVLAEDGGFFDLMCREMLVGGFRIRWHERSVVSHDKSADAAGDAIDKPTPKKQTRARFDCLDCGLKAWTKPSATLLCACNGQPLICATKKRDPTL